MEDALLLMFTRLDWCAGACAMMCRKLCWRRHASGELKEEAQVLEE
jgi:hypothetical protein